jgi:uncharacterized membrane protein YeaQ/YmgE (transglycosylase-associated protein family)
MCLDCEEDESFHREEGGRGSFRWSDQQLVGLLSPETSTGCVSSLLSRVVCCGDLPSILSVKILMHRKGYSHAQRPNCLSRRKPSASERELKVGLISWIVVGVAVGLLSEWILPESVLGGSIAAVFICVAGATFAGLVAGIVVGVGVTDVNAWTMVVAALGAIALLFAYDLVVRRAA